jgi:hypothetical protein
MASTILTFAALMKTRYSPDKVEDLTMREHPWLAEIPKDEEGAGDGEIVPLIYVNPQGISNQLSDAQGAATNIAGKRFTLLYGDLSGSVSIGHKVLVASRNNVGAFLKNQTAETDGLYEATGDAIDLALWSNGSQSLGYCSALNTNDITLSNPTDAYNFEVGMKVQSSSADGTDGSTAPNAGSTTVSAVDRASGIISLVSAAGMTGFGATDYLFRYGTYYGNTTHWTMAGVPAFIASSESPATLYSMVRTPDPTRLAGCRVPDAIVAGMSVEGRLKKLGSWMTGRYGAKGLDWGALHPEDFELLESGLSARGIRQLSETEAKFGYKALRMTVQNYDIPFYSVPRCPKGVGWIFNKKTWSLKSMGKLIQQPLNEVGLPLFPAATTNDFEYRLVCYPAAVCRAPGWNGRVNLGT